MSLRLRFRIRRPRFIRTSLRLAPGLSLSYGNPRQAGTAGMVAVILFSLFAVGYFVTH